MKRAARRVPGGFWWAMYAHGRARQLVHVGRVLEHEILEVNRWRDRGRRWTAAVRIRRSELLWPASLSQDQELWRAIRAGGGGRPVCRHERHEAGQLEFRRRTF